MIWFTSDTHFGSKRTLLLSKRPFSSVKEMDETMIKNWNALVKENDTVFHLGDFGDLEVAKKLNGHIEFIKGNYEKTIDETSLLSAFKSVSLYKSLSVGGLTLMMVHEPLKANTFPVKSDFTLFGHIHNLQKVKRDGLNVSMDAHHFRPINVEDVIFYKNAIMTHYDENVFCDKLYK